MLDLVDYLTMEACVALECEFNIGMTSVIGLWNLLCTIVYGVNLFGLNTKRVVQWNWYYQSRVLCQAIFYLLDENEIVEKLYMENSDSYEFKVMGRWLWNDILTQVVFFNKVVYVYKIRKNLILILSKSSMTYVFCLSQLRSLWPWMMSMLAKVMLPKEFSKSW